VPLLPIEGPDEHYYTERPTSRLELGVVHTQLRGEVFQFLTAPSVFSKRRVDPGTRLLIEAMELPERGTLLDLGCGYGAVGIVAASLNPNLKIIMTDVNKRAVWLAKKNIERNNVANIEVRRGQLYQPIAGLRFHTILSNPPTTAGLKVTLAIIDQAPNHLEDDGLLQLVVRTRTGGKQFLRELKTTFGDVNIQARKGGYRVLVAKKP
jgi:16S rRNA G1207 methylase RsmC